METYVAVTGPVPSIEAWETDMRAIKFPWTWGKKKKDKGVIRLGVCPIRLYKLVHPEEQQEALMNHVGISDQPNYVLERYKSLKIISKLLRKLLGLKKAPLATNPVVHMQPNNTSKAVAVVPIGTKKDMYGENGIEML